MTQAFLKSKIHYGTVTKTDAAGTDAFYVCPLLMEASGMLPGEQVHVYGKTKGSRVITVVYPGIKNEIKASGPLAKLFQENEQIIIVAFAELAYDERKKILPKIIFPDKNNSAVPVTSKVVA